MQQAALLWCRRKRKWSGPPQFEDKSGQLMMLNTDMVRPCLRPDLPATVCELCSKPATLCIASAECFRLLRSYGPVSGGRQLASAQLEKPACCKVHMLWQSLATISRAVWALSWSCTYAAVCQQVSANAQFSKAQATPTHAGGLLVPCISL